MKYPYALPVLRIHDAGDGLIQVNRGYGWSEPVLPGRCAAPEVALPPRCDIEVSALREGFRRAPQ
jgi:hypothetical protein